MQAEFKFSLDQQVTITVNTKHGVVKGLYIDVDQVKWAHVEYAEDAGRICSRYFRESEIT